MFISIPISKGLIDPNHIKKIGSSFWEFLWCVDKATTIDEDGIGWILGGKPVNLDDISRCTGKHNTSTSKNLNNLEKEGYIIIIHTPYGIKIGVKKLKKRFSENAKALGERFSVNAERFSENANRTYREEKRRSILPVNKKKMFTYEAVDDDGNKIKVGPRGGKRVLREDPFDQDKEIDRMMKAPQKFYAFIGLEIAFKELKFKNHEQLENFKAQEVRHAQKLKGYTIDEVMEAMEHTEKKAKEGDFKWNLATVGKYISEVINK